ncbi:Regulator of chromosome condensation (RCC1) repeat profile [Nakaseomyces glabratus]|nr:Regulator of chromosome condensation (RCC1) repeat profile [Nakaseomyces glabratus]
MPKSYNENDIWKIRDVFGRDLSYISSCLPSLEDYKQINLNSSDLESGYSPLHVTLRERLLQKSFLLYKRWVDDEKQMSYKIGQHILAQKDREGLTPMDLYNIEFQRALKVKPQLLEYTIDNGNLKPKVIFENVNHLDSEGIATTKSCSNNELLRSTSFLEIPQNYSDMAKIRNLGGSHLLTFGSNVNAQLGTGNKDDRQHFHETDYQQLGGDLPLDPKKFSIKEVLMSRYHCLVINSFGEVFTCGNSNRGRLGNGETNTTVSVFTKIATFETGVRHVSISNHHNLLVDGNGYIYSWGWNQYYQLGYTSSNKQGDSKHTLCKSSPKRIPYFDNINIKYVACSKVHSCALSQDNKLYLWGLNLGQMGNKKPLHVNLDISHDHNNGYIIESPLVIDLSHLQVEQVLALELVTFIRCSGNTLIVLTDFCMRTFKISTPKPKNPTRIDIFSHYTPKTISADVVDMKCSNKVGNHLFFKYASGRVGYLSLKKENVVSWSKLSNELPISFSWKPNFARNNCTDFAVGYNGDIIICTYGGEIFISRNHAEFERIHSNKLITGRAVKISSDTSLGSVAIIKQDYLFMPAKFLKDTFDFDLAIYSPIYQNVGDTLSLGSLGLQCHVKETDSQLFLSSKSNISNLRYSEINGSSVNENQIKCSSYDVILNNDRGIIECYSFKSLFSLRCSKFLNAILNDGKFTVNNELFFTANETANGILQIKTHDLTTSAVYYKISVDLVHFLLTDVKPANQQRSIAILSITDNYAHGTTLRNALSSYLLGMLTNDTDEKRIKSPGNHLLGDTILRLKDKTLIVDSFLLSARSNYFKGLLSNSVFCEKDNDGKYLINLEIYSYKQFDIILKYLYGVDFSDLHPHYESEDGGLTNFLESLVLADELCLEPLKCYMQVLLSQFIDGNSIIPLFIYSVRSNTEMLCLLCSTFIAIHIGVLFVKDNVQLISQNFDDSHWKILQNNISYITSEQLNHELWYNNTTDNWRSLFKNDINKFNSKFISPKDKFGPIFDIKDTLEVSSKKTSSDRRRSSTSTRPIKFKNTAMNNISDNPHRRQSNGSVSIAEKLSASNSSDEDSQFIEVTRKPKRKSVSNIQESQATVPKLHPPKPNILIHRKLSGDEKLLPSLISNEPIVEIPNQKKNQSEIGPKKPISFKKTSQKERIKTTTQADKQKENKTKESAWTNQKQNSSLSNPKDNQTSKLAALPSLNDSKLQKQDLKPNKKSKKKANNKQSAEFISSGNFAGLTPYLSTVHKESVTTDTTPSWTASTVSDFKQKVEAQEFEKWFQEESKRVQLELERRGSSHHDELKVLYDSSQNIPGFVIDSNVKKAGRKIKGKFKAKLKNKDENINSIQ